ncbi:MAG: PASTA domain-containing protein [Solobacterium sp.]|nr:PASTA domain-containing protein [Solobacterium sp.]
MSVDWKNRKTITLLCTAVLLFGATAAGGIYLKSLDREPVLMEDFTGKDSETVRTWAEEHRIAEDRLEFNLFYDEEIEENLIIDQNIEPGTTLKKNDLLIFSVSNGKDPGQVFTLPDFTGMTQEEISEWFDRNGFLNVSYVYEDSKDVPKNGFIAVENEQTEYRRSDEISVVISLGEGETTVTEVTVPDFSSYTRTNIQA